MRLYVRENQSPASLVNQISQLEGREIEIIFPEGSDFFSDGENLALLKNQANLLGKNIVVICENARWRALLDQYGISYKEPLKSEPASFKEFESKEEGPEIEEFTKRYFDLNPAKIPQEFEELQASEEQEQLIQPLFSKDQKIQEEPLEEELKEVSQKEWKFALYKLGASAAGIGLLIAGYFYLPQATVEVFATREKISFPFEVSAKKGLSVVDVDAKVVPIQLIQITKEVSLPFEASEKGAFSQKAKGKILVYNENPAPQFMIPSRFEASSGTIYWSLRNIRIPSRGSLEVEVAADKPGEAYNLACTSQNPCSLTIPAWKGTDNFKKVYAKAEASISGGVEGSGFIVSKETYERAETALRETLLKQATKELSEQIPGQFTLLQDSIRSQIFDVSSFPPLNGLSPDGKVTIKGKVELAAFLIRESDIKELASTLVKSQLKEDKEIKPNTVAIEYTVKKLDFEKNEVSLEVNASEEVAFKVDQEDLKRKFIGKSQEEVRDLLSKLPKIQSTKVTLWPFWVRTIPSRPDRIEITVR